ncbi:hypothetical protein BESB_016670 [Besnoitia besnoiti]|uniref:Uncharacterized protein n=1 Tax=Besnoitia besnoiti TaxID=94643 RepID=A0A2A9M335_BESBE|nr:hypothetical protein BESB_016670 [Besnoitia besnoiti]PFH32349.1 hypothetical protein BESB_016670 [Besnoitia besnoiti]
MAPMPSHSLPCRCSCDSFNMHASSSPRVPFSVSASESPSPPSFLPFGSLYYLILACSVDEYAEYRQKEAPRRMDATLAAAISLAFHGEKYLRVLPFLTHDEIENLNFSADPRNNRNVHYFHVPSSFPCKEDLSSSAASSVSVAAAGVENASTPAAEGFEESPRRRRPAEGERSGDEVEQERGEKRVRGVLVVDSVGAKRAPHEVERLNDVSFGPGGAPVRVKSAQETTWSGSAAPKANTVGPTCLSEKNREAEVGTEDVSDDELDQGFSSFFYYAPKTPMAADSPRGLGGSSRPGRHADQSSTSFFLRASSPFSPLKWTHSPTSVRWRLPGSFASTPRRMLVASPAFSFEWHQVLPVTPQFVGSLVPSSLSSPPPVSQTSSASPTSGDVSAAVTPFSGFPWSSLTASASRFSSSLSPQLPSAGASPPSPPSPLFPPVACIRLEFGGSASTARGSASDFFSKFPRTPPSEASAPSRRAASPSEPQTAATSSYLQSRPPLDTCAFFEEAAMRGFRRRDSSGEAGIERRAGSPGRSLAGELASAQAATNGSDVSWESVEGGVGDRGDLGRGKSDSAPPVEKEPPARRGRSLSRDRNRSGDEGFASVSGVLSRFFGLSEARNGRISLPAGNAGEGKRIGSDGGGGLQTRGKTAGWNAVGDPVREWSLSVPSESLPAPLRQAAANVTLSWRLAPLLLVHTARDKTQAEKVGSGQPRGHSGLPDVDVRTWRDPRQGRGGTDENAFQRSEQGKGGAGVSGMGREWTVGVGDRHAQIPREPLMGGGTVGGSSLKERQKYERGDGVQQIQNGEEAPNLRLDQEERMFFLLTQRVTVDLPDQGPWSFSFYLNHTLPVESAFLSAAALCDLSDEAPHERRGLSDAEGLPLFSYSSFSAPKGTSLPSFSRVPFYVRRQSCLAAVGTERQFETEVRKERVKALHAMRAREKKEVLVPTKGRQSKGEDEGRTQMPQGGACVGGNSGLVSVEGVKQET